MIITSLDQWFSSILKVNLDVTSKEIRTEPQDGHMTNVNLMYLVMLALGSIQLPVFDRSPPLPAGSAPPPEAGSGAA